MRKGIAIAVFLLIGIAGIYRQMTADTITFEEAFSVMDREDADIYKNSSESRENASAKEEEETIFEHDMREKPLPSEENDTDGEYYTEGYAVKVYFPEEDKEKISGLLPASAVIRLNRQIQRYLDQSGYPDASELTVVRTEGLNGHQGFLFSATEYPEAVFEVFWNDGEMKFGEVRIEEL